MSSSTPEPSQKNGKQDEKNEAPQQSKPEIVEEKSAAFDWSKVEHQQHLSACLVAFPQELVNLAGSFVPPVWEWSEELKASSVELSRDDSGRRRVARFAGLNKGWDSVLSRYPLSPFLTPAFASSPASSSSPFSSSCSVAAFEVRVDKLDGEGAMAIGVSSGYPGEGQALSKAGPSVVYHYDGEVYINGYEVSRDYKSNFEVYNLGGHYIHFDAYGVGDVIRVELDFSANSLAFFKNGVLQDQALEDSLTGIHLSEPLYAAVTMRQPGDQVTLL